jgi:DNA-directed RNA polymerase subunit RPC12/RpoP
LKRLVAGDRNTPNAAIVPFRLGLHFAALALSRDAGLETAAVNVVLTSRRVSARIPCRALAGAPMIDTVLNLLFRCSHRRLTRPVAPITKAGQPHSQSYVVCLDCGKQFEYDLNKMRIGKVIDRSHDASVVPPNMPTARKTKVKYALLAAVPAAVVLGAVLKGKKNAVKPEDGKTDPPVPDE